MLTAVSPRRAQLCMSLRCSGLDASSLQQSTRVRHNIGSVVVAVSTIETTDESGKTEAMIRWKYGLSVLRETTVTRLMEV